MNRRSPYGERLFKENSITGEPIISIHALRTGSDLMLPFFLFGIYEFQSTLPARGATQA